MHFQYTVRPQSTSFSHKQNLLSTPFTQYEYNLPSILTMKLLYPHDAMQLLFTHNSPPLFTKSASLTLTYIRFLYSYNLLYLQNTSIEIQVASSIQTQAISSINAIVERDALRLKDIGG